MSGQNIDSASEKSVIQEICADIARAEPHSVVLNFECCSCASENGFSSHSADLMKIVKVTDSQHLFCFSLLDKTFILFLFFSRCLLSVNIW